MAGSDLAGTLLSYFFCSAASDRAPSALHSIVLSSLVIYSTVGNTRPQPCPQVLFVAEQVIVTALYRYRYRYRYLLQ